MILTEFIIIIIITGDTCILRNCGHKFHQHCLTRFARRDGKGKFIVICPDCGEPSNRIKKEQLPDDATVHSFGNVTVILQGNAFDRISPTSK